MMEQSFFLKNTLPSLSLGDSMLVFERFLRFFYPSVIYLNKDGISHRHRWTSHDLPILLRPLEVSSQQKASSVMGAMMGSTLAEGP